MSDEWRTLGPEEFLEDGDEYWDTCDGEWKKTCFKGWQVNEFEYRYRRRVSPEKEAVANLEANPYYLALRHAEEKLQQAEKERDELKGDLESFKNCHETHRAEIGELEKQRSEWRSDNERLRAENAGLREVCQNLLGKALESPELGRGWSAVPDEVFEQAKAALAAKGETK